MAEAQPVPRVGGEGVVEAQRGEVAPDGGIYLAGRRAGLQAGLAGADGAQARLEELALPGRRAAADGEGVGEVPPVTGDDHREVEQEQVALLDLPRGRRPALVGLGPRAGGEVAVDAHLLAEGLRGGPVDEQPGVELGHARAHLRQGRRLGGLAGAHRAPQGLDLVGVLRPPQRPDQRADVDRPRAPAAARGGPRPPPPVRTPARCRSAGRRSRPGGRGPTGRAGPGGTGPSGCRRTRSARTARPRAPARGTGPACRRRPASPGRAPGSAGRPTRPSGTRTATAHSRRSRSGATDRPRSGRRTPTARPPRAARDVRRIPRRSASFNPPVRLRAAA